MHDEFSLSNWENKLTSESDGAYFAGEASGLHAGLALSVQNLNAMQGFRPELRPLPAPLVWHRPWARPGGQCSGPAGRTGSFAFSFNEIF